MKAQHDTAIPQRILPLRTRLPRAGVYALGLVTVAAGAYVSMLCLPTRPWLVRLFLVATLVVLYLLKEGYRRLRVRKIRIERFTPRKPYFWEVGTPGELPALADQGMFASLTGLAGNRPVLLLVEKLSEADHLTVLYDLFCERLRQSGRKVVRYYHRGDLRVFWNEEAGSGRSVSELATSYGDYDLIIGGDAHRAFSPTQDDLHPWAADFRSWVRKWVLTPAPVVSWSDYEAELATVFTVLPFTGQGISVLAGHLQNKASAAPVRFDSDVPLFRLDEPGRDLWQKLEQYGGEPLAQWIAAATVCSRLEPALTLRLGRMIFGEENSLLTCDNFRHLARLDWFRTGTIPAPVRRRLIAGLPAPLLDRIRTEIVAVMEDNPPPSPSHALNDYRMELAGLKLMLPGYAAADFKNELYELRTMGYEEDVGLADWIENQKSWFERLIPRSMDRYVYREGAYLLGWSNWFVLPLFLFISAAAAYVPLDIPATPPPATGFNMDFEVQSMEGDRLAGAYLEIFGPDETLEGRTDDQGQWRTVMPASWQGDRWPVRVSRSGYETLETELDLLPKREVLRLRTVEPPGDGSLQISGRVMSVDGEPLAGAGLRLAGASILSENDGSFRLERDGPLDQTTPLQVSKRGFFARTVPVSPTDRRLPAIYLTPEVLSGRVYDAATNRGLSGVEITGSGIRKTTGTDGSFRIELPDTYREATKVTLTLARESYISRSEEVTLTTRSVSLYLQKEEEKFLMGQVIDADHRRPVSGVAVTLRPQGAEVRTDANGRYRFRLAAADLRSRFEIDLEKDGYQPLRRVNVSNNETVPLTRATRFIRGRVTDERGNSLSEAWFRAPLIEVDGETDRSGNFQIEVPGGYDATAIRVYFGKMGYSETSRSLAVGSGDNLIRLASAIRNIRITGTLKEACSGGNISSIGIRAVAGRGFEQKTYRDLGYFAYELQLPPDYNGRIALILDSDRYGEHTEYIDPPFRNEMNVGEIRLRDFFLSGRVTDDRGTPLSGAVVNLVRTNLTATSDARGYFRINLPGNYQSCEAMLQAARSGYTPTDVVTVRLGQESTIVMRRQATDIIISGTVLNAQTGEGIPDARVGYKDGAGNFKALVFSRGSAGAFETKVKPGNVLYNTLREGGVVTLMAEKDNFFAGEVNWRNGQGTVTIRLQPEIRGIRLILKLPLTVQIRRYRKPVPNLKVDVYNSRGGTLLGSAVTDDNGEAKVYKNDGSNFQAGEKVYIDVPALRIEQVYPQGGSDRVVPESLLIELLHDS